MRFVSTVYAYDLMDTVHATVVVRRYEENESTASSIEYECTTTVPGIGETDPRLWTKDALIGLLEAI